MRRSTSEFESEQSKMIFIGWTFAMLVTVACVTCNLELDDENHITFLLENEKNETKNSFFWGLFDTTATVGMVFQYNISSVFPYGLNAEYVVSEVGSNVNKLPDWLHFDKATGCLIGVPSPSDAANTFYLKVSHVDNDNSAFEVGDVFSIKVSEHTPYYMGRTARPLQSYDESSTMVQCLPSSAVTTTTVIVDVDLNSLLPSERVEIIQNMCQYLGLSVKAARLISHGTMPLVDNTALVAGPGDVKIPLHPGAWLQWEVGCGNVFAYHLGILQKLESASQNGDLSSHIGYGITGWHVSNTKTLHKSVHRLKRQAPVLVTTATAVETVRPPAAKVVPTLTVSESESTGDPPTRVVPSLTSPGYSMTDAIDLDKPHHANSSAKHERVTKSKTAKTKTKTSVRPTTPVQVIPTDASYERFTSTVSSSVIDSDLEPSAIMPQGTSTVPTASLDTKMYIMTDSSLTPPNNVVQTSRALSTSDVFSGMTSLQTTKPLLEDSAPVVNSELGTISTTVRKVFIYKIPDHIFSDSVDGSTKNLILQFSMPDDYGVNITRWIQFSEETQTLSGFPLSTSNQQYFLTATNSRGRSGRLGFYIYVREPRKDQRVNFEMSVILEADYKKFVNNISALVDIATKISAAFGDEDQSQLMITSIDQGSVKYSWTNSSLSSTSCPADQILTLAESFITQNGSLNSHFLETLEPYVIRKATFIPKGSCAFEAREAVLPLLATTPGPPIASTPAVEEVEIKSAETGLFITTIVPIVIIAALVILAIIIACVLCCKRRSAKQPDRVGRKSTKKGTPIIFTNELEEKENLSMKPLIMENEKPPQPPDYQQAIVVSSYPVMPDSERHGLLVSDNQTHQTQARVISEKPTHNSTTRLQQRPVVPQSSHRKPPLYGST